MKKTIVTPMALDEASKALESAMDAKAIAKISRETAESAAFEASKADARKNASFVAAGIVEEGGGDNNPPPSNNSDGGGNNIPPTPPKPPSGGGKGSKGCCWCSWLAIALALLALIGCAVMWSNKAPNSAIEEIKKSLSFQRSEVEDIDKMSKSASKKAEQALVASEKKSEVSCSTVMVAPKKAPKPKAEAQAVAPAPKAVAPAPAPVQPVAPVVVPQAQNRPFLWHPHDATDDNPKPCIISGGNGTGLPKYCSISSTIPARKGEDKFTWGVRVGGGERPTDTGLYTHK